LAADLANEQQTNAKLRQELEKYRAGGSLEQQDEIKRLQNENKKLNDELKLSEERLRASVSELKTTESTLQKEIDDLKKIINDSQAELQRLKGDKTRDTLITGAQKELKHLSPWIGIELLKPDFENPNQRAVRVETVKSGGPAEASGLRTGDEIERANGQITDHNPKFAKVIATVHPGDVLSCQVKRGNEMINLRVEVSSKQIPYAQIRQLRRIASGVILPGDQDFLEELARKLEKSGDKGK